MRFDPNLRVFGPKNLQSHKGPPRQRGYGVILSKNLPAHRGLVYQRGYGHQVGLGIFSSLGRLFGRFIPVASKAVKQVIASKAAKDIGKQLATSATTLGANLAADILDGNNAKESSIERLQQAKSEIAESIRQSAKKIKAKPSKVKKKVKRKAIALTPVTTYKRKRLTYDIFEDESD